MPFAHMEPGEAPLQGEASFLTSLA